MGTQEFVALLGEEVSRNELTVAKVRTLADVLTAGYPFAALLQCWRFPDTKEGLPHEGLIIDVDVEVSQQRVNDIRRVERVAVAFREDDRFRPEVLALRTDFPHVPHLNISPWGSPRSLCLSDQPYSETKLGWTPAGFIETIRTWFRLTAAGALHQDDQPLEPLLGGAEAKIILPFDLFQNDVRAEALVCYATDPGDGSDTPKVILAEREGSPKAPPESPAYVAVPISVKAPMTHGVIQWQPTDLSLLHQFLLAAGTDLLSDLRQRLRVWAEDPVMLKRKAIFVVAVQKRRTEDSPVETTETWAFLTDKTLEEIRIAVGVHAKAGGLTGLLLNIDSAKQGEEVRLELLLPYYTLSRHDAALFNARPNPGDINVVAVGLGALGSQVFDNLMRGGFGAWTLVDDDHVLPHNLARHELHGNAVGFAKVVLLAHRANQTIAGPDIATPLVTNVLEAGGQAGPLDDAFTKANLILDMSASVAVARHLARDLDAGRARRTSLFLSPSGRDLVLLAEDVGRRHRLDALEMQYYRALITEPDLTDHLGSTDGRARYGRSCRDVTRLLPQDMVALHAAVGSRAVRQALEVPHAQIKIWRAAEDLSVTCIRTPIAPVEEQTLSGWTLVTDATVLDRVRDLREAKLPVETGGILLGSFDTQRRIVYIVDIVPSPADSIERTDLYIRGSQGLRDEVSRVQSLTAGWLRYAGEWHSHPNGATTRPSGDDRKLFGWLGEMMAGEGLPPLMLIVGETAHRWALGELPLVDTGGNE